MIPSSELIITFARAGGAGGQNVNKVSSKAIARWPLLQTRVLTPAQKSLALFRLRSRLTGAGEIVVQAESERSQAQNKAAAIRRLNVIVAAAIKPIKLRRATKPSRAARVRRLENKEKHSRKKRARQVSAFE